MANRSDPGFYHAHGTSSGNAWVPASAIAGRSSPTAGLESAASNMDQLHFSYGHFLYGQFLYVTKFILTKFIRSIFIRNKIYTVKKFIQ